MAYADGEREGGWLAFFLVTLGVFTPVTTFFSVYQLARLEGSERVANTYRPQPEDDGLADVFE